MNTDVYTFKEEEEYVFLYDHDKKMSSHLVCLRRLSKEMEHSFDIADLGGPIHVVPGEFME